MSTPQETLKEIRAIQYHYAKAAIQYRKDREVARAQGKLAEFDNRPVDPAVFSPVNEMIIPRRKRAYTKISPMEGRRRMEKMEKERAMKEEEEKKKRKVEKKEKK